MTIGRHQIVPQGFGELPTPTEARAAARRQIPRSAFRGAPVFDGHWAAQVHQDCESADPTTPRLWASRVPR